MNRLVLRKLTVQDESAFLKALSEWDANSGFTWVRDYKHGMNFSDYIDLLRAYENGEQLAKGYVADTSLFGFLNSEIVGRLAIRHELNDFLLKVGGHIGYGVLPRFRRKGFAKAMLALSLPLAKKMELGRVLITCDDNNIGSIKAIEANGGILENIISIEKDKPFKRRYWIDLK